MITFIKIAAVVTLIVILIVVLALCKASKKGEES